MTTAKNKIEGFTYLDSKNPSLNIFLEKALQVDPQSCSSSSSKTLIKGFQGRGK